MSSKKTMVWWLVGLWAWTILAPPCRAAWGDGVYVRFKVEDKSVSNYFIQISGYIHNDPWYIPSSVWPEKADRAPILRTVGGQFTPWLDLMKAAQGRLHRRLNRAGGIAEFPNVVADFKTDPPVTGLVVTIELAPTPDEKQVVKTFRESLPGTRTSFLVSPNLRRDAPDLETAAEMSARRLRWAREVTGGKRASPQRHIIQTGLWGNQRPDLDMQEAEVLWLLGFNVLSHSSTNIAARYAFQTPAHTHNILVGLNTTREQVESAMDRVVAPYLKAKKTFTPGMPFNFLDEIVSRNIGNNSNALAGFHTWLRDLSLDPAFLGVADLNAVVPIETPDELRRRQSEEDIFAQRIFYYTTRYRQWATTERFCWNTEALHKRLGPAPMSSTLVADHPYFAGTGLGMGMGPNPAWGSTPLAADWFDFGRRKAVDAIGIEDWLGLQYMYGPRYTWEGFQLMGFQAAIFRSASQGKMPIISWITPSDKTNLLLKCSSALCQGSRHFYFWSYGPTATSTENYWSDLRPEYEGISTLTRQLAEAESITAEGSMRPTRLAMLYSIASDIWQPYGYIHMLERRLTYLALVHRQYLVDFLSEEDVEQGRLKNYDVLYTVDPCIRSNAAVTIARWVERGGHLYAAAGAGLKDEFNEPSQTLYPLLGINTVVSENIQSGTYHLRSALNYIRETDSISMGTGTQGRTMGVVGVRIGVSPAKDVAVLGRFSDGSPAIISNRFGRGDVVWIGACPGLTYGKEARFVSDELAERWPVLQGDFIAAAAARVPRLVQLSHPVVEAGIFDASAGSALVLANFTYEPIKELKVELTLPKAIKSIRSTSRQSGISFQSKASTPEQRTAGYPVTVTFTTPLDLNDIILCK